VRLMREGFGRLEKSAFNQVSFNMLGHDVMLRVSNSWGLRKPPFA
jgi:hypothetical protein